MKKIMCLLGLVVGLYYGLVQVRLESPLFQKQVDGLMKDLSQWSGFTLGESVAEPYNFVKSEVVPNVKQNFASYFAGMAILVSTLILKRRGKTTTQAFRAAVLHVPEPTPIEHPVLVKARNKTVRMQLLADQIGVQNRLKVIPERIKDAQKDHSYAQDNLAKAESALTKAQQVFDAKTAALNKLNAERDELILESGHIQDELAKLEIV